MAGGGTSVDPSLTSPADGDPRVEIHRAQERERIRKKREERGTPEAESRRRASRDAYTDLSAVEALAIARSKFGSLINTPLSRPPALGNDRILDYPTDTSALLDLGNGKRGLVVASEPLTAGSGHDKAPVDLDLEQRGADFAPSNPAVPVQLGATARRGFRLSRTGLGLIPIVDNDKSATRVGDKLFYGNAYDGDADLLAAPTTGGFQVFAQLRSADSPEVLRYEIDAPAGAQASLTGVAEHPETRAVEVRDGDELVGHIASPSAVDAEGEPVKVRYELDGLRLSLYVDHRDAEVRWPIMVDPSVTEDFLSWRHDSAIGFDRWDFQLHGWAMYGYKGYRPGHRTDIPDLGRGLHIFGDINMWYNRGFDGEFVWGAPRKSRIFRADFNHTYHRWDWDCTEQGVWGPNRPGGAWWDGPFVYENQQVWTRYHCWTLDNDQWTLCPTMNPCADSAGSPGNYLIFKLREDYFDGVRNTAPSAYLGGVAISLTDDEDPKWDRLIESGFPPSNEWQDSGTFSIQPTASDDGLGMMQYRWSVPGRATEIRTHPCVGSSRCPYQWENPDPKLAHLGYNVPFTGDIANMPSGYQRVTLRAYDAIEKPTSAVDRDIKVDRVKPRIDSKSGILWDDRVESDPADGGAMYRWPAPLHVRAVDDHSGIASVQLLVDGVQKQPSHLVTGSCSASGCQNTLDAPFTLSLRDVTPGFHTVTIKVKDQLADKAGVDGARHAETQSWLIWVPERVTEMDEEEGFSASSTSTASDDLSTPADSPDSSTCPTNVDFSDPLWCKPVTTDSTAVQIDSEPGVDVPVADPLSGARIAQWRLAESSGNVARDSIGSHHGTYTDGYSLGQTGALTHGDAGVKLDGVSGRVTTTYSPFTASSALTFEGWAKRNTNTGADVLFAGDSISGWPVLRMLYGNDVRFNPDTTGAGQDFVGALPGTGVWFHWALVWNAATRQATLYINGVNKGTLTFTHGFGGSPGNLELGAEGGSLSALDGYLDDVSVYSRALTASEISQRSSLTVQPGSQPGSFSAQSSTTSDLGACAESADVIDAPSPSVTKRYALSDQQGLNNQDEIYEDPQIAALGVQTARLIVPYDLVRKASEGFAGYCEKYRNVRHWVAHMQKLGIQPLVSFEQSHTVYDPPRQPTMPKYRGDIKRFMDIFKYVRHYTAWNEPNHPRHSKQYTDGRLHGEMWANANGICKTRGCKVGAGDFSDKTKYLTTDYLSAYRTGMGPSTPNFWAYHTYYMINKPTKPDTLTRFLNWGPVKRKPVVWITEAGSYKHTTSGSVDDQQQAKKLSDFFNTPSYRLNAEHPTSPIKRFYYYFIHAAQPQPQQGEDAGLWEYNRSCYRLIYRTYLEKATGRTDVPGERPPCPP